MNSTEKLKPRKFAEYNESKESTIHNQDLSHLDFFD